MKKLKCMVISDTHGLHNEILFTDEYINCNVFIFAGDWSRGKGNIKETREFFEWVDQLDFKYKIIIAGNHEVFVERNKVLFLEILKDFPNINYLENESIKIEGIKFYGSPYSNEFFNWAFMEYEFKLIDIWNNIDNDTNVLITHGPAYNCLDEVLRSYGPDNNVGSPSLSKRKKELKNLKVHCSGHIHESYGSFIDNQDVLNINASFVTVQYKPMNKPIVFEI